MSDAEAAQGYPAVVAARVEAAQAEEAFVLRWNPCACDCPPLEVRLGAVWQRVEIDAEGLSAEARASFDGVRGERGAGRDRRVFRVAGRLEEGVNRCGRGALTVTLRALGGVEAVDEE